MLKLFLPLILVIAAFIGSGDVIHACVNNDNGAVRIVSADTTCDSSETALEWGIVGIQGPQGETGSAGPQGPKGDTGVGDIGCSTEQVAKWDGSQWVCSSELADLKADVAALQDLLIHFSRTGNTVTLTGANLQVVNGTGTTDGNPNSLGNVIIGYNEGRIFPGAVDIRSGSHVLVVGKEHNYSSYGGIVVGYRNTISGTFSTVSGGSGNIASGDYSSVSGGNRNLASGFLSSVSGGLTNEASGEWSAVSGGTNGEARSSAASVSGGRGDIAAGTLGGKWCAAAVCR